MGMGTGMVALKTERRVFLWRISPAVSPSGVDRTATIAEIVAILEAQKAAGSARVYISSGRLLEDDDPDRDEKINFSSRR